MLASGLGMGSSSERAVSALAQAAAGPCFLVGLSVARCFVCRPFVCDARSRLVILQLCRQGKGGKGWQREELG